MRVEAQDHRKRDVYINHELDDLGLDPYAFRIYARLARRAGTPKGAYESAAEMAKGCRMSERRVHQALADLIAHGLVAKTSRPGDTSVFHLRDKSEWRTHARDAEVGSAPHAEGGLHEVQTGSASGADKGKQGKTSNRKTPPQSPPAAEAASGSPNGDALSTRQTGEIQKRGSPAEAVVEAYNAHRGRLPAAQKLNSARRRRINQLVKDLGVDEAIAAMGIAASEVANDEFWLRNEYGLDNLLAQQRVVQKAETAANRGTTNRTEGRRERYLSALEGL